MDLSQTYESIQSRLEALKTYKDVSDAEKELRKSAGNSQSPANAFISSQLSSVEEQKKRFYFIDIILC